MTEQNQTDINQGRNKIERGVDATDDTAKNAIDTIEDVGKSLVDRISNAMKDVTAR